MDARNRERHIQHKMNSCIHFNGVQHKACKAGVVYSEVVYCELLGSDPGWAAHMPCLRDDKATVSCERAKFPTREEAEREAVEWEARTERFLNAAAKAHEHAKARGFGKGHGGTGCLPCPTGCGGELRYSVAAHNGHMHAACTTKGCVSWME